VRNRTLYVSSQRLLLLLSLLLSLNRSYYYHFLLHSIWNDNRWFYHDVCVLSAHYFGLVIAIIKDWMRAYWWILQNRFSTLSNFRTTSLAPRKTLLQCHDGRLFGFRATVPNTIVYSTSVLCVGSFQSIVISRVPNAVGLNHLGLVLSCDPGYNRLNGSNVNRFQKKLCYPTIFVHQRSNRNVNIGAGLVSGDTDGEIEINTTKYIMLFIVFF